MVYMGLPNFELACIYKNKITIYSQPWRSILQQKNLYFCVRICVCVK